ncbi:MAG TPA: L-threonylcarbamoyladenylate synthase [Thermoanaerobaculia bacterium]|nr:L-threonylcarbamoyladenylate synthase [Thermoanaerobaculia bacterium]
MTAPRGSGAIPKARTWRSGEPVEPLRALLARGGLLAFPTESSYALGADPRNPAGVAAVYRIKGRDESKALPVVAANLEQLFDLGIDPALPILSRLAAVWPAALTAVLPLAPRIPASGGGATLAVRIPDHAELRALLAAVGPLTATSANRAGEPPIPDAARAALWLAGEAEVAVIEGRAGGGPPSTLVACDGAAVRVLRAGPVALSRLTDVPDEGDA